LIGLKPVFLDAYLVSATRSCHPKSMKSRLFSNCCWLACLLLGLIPTWSQASGGSIHNHLTLDILPIALSANNPGGAGLGLSYDRYHDWLRSSYTITIESTIPYAGDKNRIDVMTELGFFTEITKPFALGARVGLVTNNPGGPAGFGAIGLRLPALEPEKKEFMSFFYEEIDLGLNGSGERYAALRLAMTLL
jgi:hypothetical protein